MRGKTNVSGVILSAHEVLLECNVRKVRQIG